MSFARQVSDSIGKFAVQLADARGGKAIPPMVAACLQSKRQASQPLRRRARHGPYFASSTSKATPWRGRRSVALAPFPLRLTATSSACILEAASSFTY